MPLLTLYGATKAAVSSLARTLRAELAPAGVRVHDVEPAWTVTPLADSYAAALGELTGEPVRAPAPPLSPADVAEVVAWCVAAPPLVNIAHVAVTPTWLP
jgi:NADP-dependent 3-hydroxy acid dehydrogenase YdfG